jgi:hypothetical protein
MIVLDFHKVYYIGYHHAATGCLYPVAEPGFWARRAQLPPTFPEFLENISTKVYETF